MVRKNPNSAAWLTKCLDIALTFTDATKEKAEDAKPMFSMLLTIPTYDDLVFRKGDGLNSDVRNSYSKMMLKMAEALGAQKISGVLVNQSNGGSERAQYLIEKPGGFSEAENFILSNFMKIAVPFLGAESAKLWKDKLELEKPSGVVMFKPGEKQYNYAMTQALETWIMKAFVPFTQPYMGIVFASDDRGNGKYSVTEFDGRNDYFRQAASKVFSENFISKIRLNMNELSVLNVKVFPLSPYKANLTPPSLVFSSKKNSVTLKTTWVQGRLHWNLAEKFLSSDILPKYYRQKTKCDADSGRERITRSNKYPDEYGMDILYSNRLIVNCETKEDAHKIYAYLKRLCENLFGGVYTPYGDLPEAEKYLNVEGLVRSAKEKSKELSLECDLVNIELEKENNDKAERMNNPVTNRIVPYANHPAVFIQYATEEEEEHLPSALGKAIKEVLAENPDWKFSSRYYHHFKKSYISAHLSSNSVTDAGELAERYRIAQLLADKANKYAGERLISVQDPDDGFEIETSIRKIDQGKVANREQKALGLFIKVPTVIKDNSSLGMRLSESDDPDSLIDVLPPQVSSLYKFGAMFGKNGVLPDGGKKNPLRAFVNKSGANEEMTQTWMCRLPSGDDKDAKVAEIHDFLSEKAAELFEGKTDVHINKLVNRDALMIAKKEKFLAEFTKDWTANEAELPNGDLRPKEDSAPSTEEAVHPAEDKIEELAELGLDI